MNQQKVASLTGTVFDVRRYSIHDGPGIRTTVFLKGCPLDCWWCHNPESQDSHPELVMHANRCILCLACKQACQKGAISQDREGNIITQHEHCDLCGMCVQACQTEARQLVGKNTSISQLMKEIERDIPFFDQSGGGLTLSGGEPLLQPQFTTALLQACRSIDIHTALDTCGFTSWKILEATLPFVNLFLFDIKMLDDEKHRLYTGVANQSILNNLRELDRRGAAIILRVPIIPTINDGLEEITALGKLATSLAGVQRVDLLPYHPIARSKYERLSRPCRMNGICAPNDELMATLKYQLERFGLCVRIGG